MTYDLTLILLIAAMAFSGYAQFKVKSAYSRFSQVANMRGMTGAQAARRILDANGLQNVPVEVTPGTLTDHYDPRSHVMRLSQGVYGARSVAAVSIAAHESGHAIQHSVGYAPLQIRNTIVPAVNFASNMAWPLAIIGLVLGGAGSILGSTLFNVGVVMYAVAVFFQVITLPVELDASSRAIKQMEGLGIIESGEKRGAKSVLSAAALTYLAATFVAVVNLLRLLALRGNND